MKLSIITPVYNEEDTVKQLMEMVSSVKYPMEYEHVVVNDGSTDGTVEKILEAKNGNVKFINVRKNGGKGFAIRQGLKEASGDIFIIQDADLEYDPSQIPAIIKPILDGKTEVVFGSRLMCIQDGYQNRLHNFGNRFLTIMTNLIYGTRLTDMETCYKAFTKNVLGSFSLKCTRFDFEPEITAKIAKKKFSILEVPIRVNPRRREEGKKITWRDGIKALFYLIKYRFVD